jgi:hypothetical protein
VVQNLDALELRWVGLIHVMVVAKPFTS